ncbi:MAG TPA: outer membrane protein assembly factor BamE [Rhizomicrobium sp.]|jgi:outer membrane protein assembly factor BamE (lipoprotein component of BamABCDE complex)|nr:outer membrane protein assembly factor BamE [Rhizomicrobium sp.]
MRIAAVALSSVLVLAACAPVVTQRGYLPDPDTINSVEVGKDTKTSIQKRLGDPSTEASFGTEGWYYISSTEKQVAFFSPTVLNRSILAVYFDKDGKVTDLKHYGLKDGHVVDYEARVTPSKGRELTFLQQLFNSSPGAPGGIDQGERNPGGGQGPPN